MPGLNPGTLYVVATPLGNRDDITLRALKVLREVDLIAAEDTRKTHRFLALHGISNRLISCHEHNETERTPALIAKLQKGVSIALVSNAGTPAVSDPGYRLIKGALDNHLEIIPVPGVCAATAALSVAGLPTDSFIFLGFLTKKKAKRIRQLSELASQPRTLIFYESPKRILTLLNEIIDVMGDRRGVLGREITKLHEEILRGRLSELIDSLSHRPAVKGECTLLVKGCEENKDLSKDVIQAELIDALGKKGSKISEISRNIAKKYGLSKNEVYEEALKLKRKER